MNAVTRLSVLATLLIAPFASAHHGPPTDPTLFYTDRIIEMDAVITAVFWRNPHIRYKATVVNDFGDEEEWQIELRRGPTSFRNIGLTRDFLQPGDKVKVAGYPSRRKENLLGLMNMLLPDGRELVEPNVEPRFSDNLVLSGIRGENLPARERSAAEKAAEVAGGDSIYGVWGMEGTHIPEVPVSEYIDYLSNTAHTLRARFVPARDDPELKCLSGMPSTMFDPPPMQVVREGENIRMKLLEYDIERLIYLDGGIENPESSPVGYSVGHWEDESTLVVATSYVNWPFFDAWGTPQTDQVSYVERFTLADNGRRLEYSLTADDPVMFVEPVVLERAWKWMPGRKLGKFDCTLWDGDDLAYDPLRDNPFGLGAKSQ